MSTVSSERAREMFSKTLEETNTPELVVGGVEQIEEEVQEEVVAEVTSVEEQEEEVAEDASQESITFEVISSDELGSQEQETTPVEEVKPIGLKDKVKYNLTEYIEDKKDVLENYFKLKSLDVDSMADVDLVRYKLTSENPNWTREDVEDELKQIYGVGLKLKDIDYDNLTDSEIKELESYNQQIDSVIKRGARLLKTESDKVSQQLKNDKENLALPEVDIEVALDVEPSKIIEEYFKEEQEEHNKYIEEVWKPSIEEAVGKVGGFRQTVKIEVSAGVEVDQELTYKLTDAQKNRLKEYMGSYLGHPEDLVFTNKETGEVDYKGLVSKKAKELFADSIILAGIKEGIAKFKEEYVKNHQVNYSDGATTRRISTDAGNSIIDGFNKRASLNNPRGLNPFD